MTVDATTVLLLQSVLNTDAMRKVFKTISEKQIADPDVLSGVQATPEALQGALKGLQDADLIGAGRQGKYYVTAKGLKVARDLSQLQLGAL